MNFENLEDMKEFCKYNKIDVANLLWDTCEKSQEKIEALKAENERLTKQLENSVQLPCKVGYTVYFNTYKNNATECIGVQPHKVESICVGYYVGNHTAIYDYDFGNSVFLTKPEALTRACGTGGRK